MIEDSEKRVKEIKDRYMPKLMTYPHVTGVGISEKITDGKRQDQICIRVYVDVKKDLSELKPEEVLPTELEGIPVDVIGGADFRAQ